jgi:hypothetical protein
VGPDLYVTSAVIDELRGTLTSVTGRLDGARRALGSVDPAVVGAAPLTGQVHDYAGSWQYGVTQLGEHAQRCAQLLATVGAAFDQVDAQLSSELRGAGSRQPGSRQPSNRQH